MGARMVTWSERFRRWVADATRDMPVRRTGDATATDGGFANTGVMTARQYVDMERLPGVVRDRLPRRGDAVEAWIKRTRDEWANGDAYRALDGLLDDYRDHADTGTSLDQPIEGPHPEGEIPRADALRERLDDLLAESLPLAGGEVRAAILKLQQAFAKLDAERAAQRDPFSYPCSYPGCGKPTAWLRHADGGIGWGWRHINPDDEVKSHVGYPMERS